MVSTSTLIRYYMCRAQHAYALGYKKYKMGHLQENAALGQFVFKRFTDGDLTKVHWIKGEEMAPTFGKETTLLVRKLAYPDPTRVFVGDVVVLENPEKPDDYLVRKLAAIEGYEMASTDEKEEPFVLEENQCWVLAENEKLKAKEAIDSRTFGPVHMINIVGRVAYCLRSAVDHGPVKNSYLGMQNDSPVLEVELDVEEMIKSHKANFNSEDH